MRSRLFYFLPVILALLLSGCREAKQQVAEAVPFETWLPLRIDDVQLEIQLALSPPEQQKGLMYRESLPADGGMLFPYREPRQMSFWMANTPLPLDIGFFDASGKLLEIRRMVPYDTRSIQSRSWEAQFALEMNFGWFFSKGLLPGAQLDLQTLAEAGYVRRADAEDMATAYVWLRYL